jgi:UDP-N-acetylmuramate: L-alanyl-gamma-D-glutamyl-meso-diaminopimelate ligase
MLEQGCWTPVENFGLGEDSDWRANFTDAGQRRIRIVDGDGGSAEAGWKLGGTYNLENALAAVAAAKSAGVPLNQAVDALSRFNGVKRRMERTATVSDIAIYDDFAHHPTAIERAIKGLKKHFPGQRNNATLAGSLQEADLIYVYRPDELAGDFDASLADLGKRLRLFSDYDELQASLESILLAGDQMVFMSNGGFGGTRQKLTMALQKNQVTTD